MRNFGTAANQVLWRGQAPLIGDPSFADDAVFADGPVAGAASTPTTASVPLARKIIEDKPDTVAPRCTDGHGNERARPRCATRRSPPTARRARAPTAR